MTITTYCGGSVQTNGYIVEAPGGVLVIDAPDGMADTLRDRGLQPAAVLLTHQHFDHVEGATELSRMGAPIYAWSAFSHELILDQAAARWGLPIVVEPFTVDHLLEGTHALHLAGLDFGLMHVPGHSPDSVVFALPELAFTGDTLFAGSIGRPDLPGGDYQLLLKGIREKLLSLPADTRILPGHGPETTPGTESATNPYFT